MEARRRGGDATRRVGRDCRTCTRKGAEAARVGEGKLRHAQSSVYREDEDEGEQFFHS